MLTRLIGENVQLKLDLAPDLPRVKVDSGQMDQTLINLALNARDAMPQGGQLRISTTNIQLDADDLPMHPEGRIGSFVCLAITDNGVGMSREIQAHIFEPFFTTKEQGKGSGLGLATVYGIVKQHDGWITVYSEPGRGTSFRMYLPALAGEVAGAPHDGAAAPVAPPALGHGERILLIEDDPLVRRMAQQMLNRRGYRTIAVSSCAEAHAAYNSQFDLVFSDVILPDGNGLELARQLQLRRPNLRCILTSGYADIHERWPEIEQQRWPFLVKPYSQADLLHALAVALAHD
jgi:CheY-like chemotaxis protein